VNSSVFWYNIAMNDGNKLIEVARELIEGCSDDKNHTVASAILTTDGSIVTGINLYHFTGGPCAEITALANMASEKKKPQLIVAVGTGARGVLSPCGRCRQVLFDYYPDIEVIALEKGELSAKTIKELLPAIYDWNAEQE
jgi:cytidine deaminase